MASSVAACVGRRASFADTAATGGAGRTTTRPSDGGSATRSVEPAARSASVYRPSPAGRARRVERFRPFPVSPRARSTCPRKKRLVLVKGVAAVLPLRAARRRAALLLGERGGDVGAALQIVAQRADEAGGLPRGADRQAKIHQRLIPVVAAPGGDRALGERPELAVGEARLRRARAAPAGAHAARGRAVPAAQPGARRVHPALRSRRRAALAAAPPPGRRLAAGVAAKAAAVKFTPAASSKWHFYPVDAVVAIVNLHALLRRPA